MHLANLKRSGTKPRSEQPELRVRIRFSVRVSVTELNQVLECPLVTGNCSRMSDNKISLSSR